MAVARVACPTCRRLIEWTPAEVWRPFCSERCKLIDLGAWFSGERAIPGSNEPDISSAGEDEDPPAER
jgi:endogenous inhibitor of DNA gyrase (YacG/DUF329 family)